MLIASASGGMDIEEVPEENIVKHHIDTSVGLLPYAAREIFRRMGLDQNIAKEFYSLAPTLYKIFREKDCELVEINPLVISGDRLIAADAKVTIDDEALYRQKDLPHVEERTEAEQKRMPWAFPTFSWTAILR